MGDSRQIGELLFELFPSRQGLMLRVSHLKARVGLEGRLTEKDRARLGGWFSPPAPPIENGLDLKLVHKIVSAGVRVLARKAHPDAGGSNERMSKLNTAAEEIRSRLRG